MNKLFCPNCYAELLFDPPMLLRRLPVNLLFISGFIHGLIKAKKAQNVLKEEGNKDKTL